MENINLYNDLLQQIGNERFEEFKKTYFTSKKRCTWSIRNPTNLHLHEVILIAKEMKMAVPLLMDKYKAGQDEIHPIVKDYIHQ